MISEQLFEEYLELILQGRRSACSRIVQELLDKEIPLTTLYTELFQKSLYRIGELWEQNRISVAREHLVTAITEGLLHQTYPLLFRKEVEGQRKKVVISCTANEYHQVGGKMAADLFEFNGWDSHFLGANTPIDHMLEYIQEVKPELVGLSLSIYFNMPSLKAGIEAIRSDFPDQNIVVGGQAFKWGGLEPIRHYSGIEYIESVNDFERLSI